MFVLKASTYEAGVSPMVGSCAVAGGAACMKCQALARARA
jgi:hypothetical protein